MADKRPPQVFITLPKGTARFPHTRKPDTEGQYASGKFDTGVVFPGDTDFSAQEAKIKAAAKAKRPKLNLDELILPWKFHDEDAKNEDLRGKFTVVSKSGFAPKLYDAKKVLIEDPKLEVWGGDEVKIAGTLYLYEKVEKVKDSVTKKMVDETIYGATLQLNAVQIIAKRGGGSGGDYSNAFEEEDGYTASSVATGTGDDESGDF